jgi:hypothetical protein
MKTAAYGLSYVRQERILAGKLQVISFPSDSRIVKYFNDFGLTHLSLPDNKAVAISFSRTHEAKNHYRDKIMEYTEFKLGEIVDRTCQDTLRTRKITVIENIPNCEKGELKYNVKWNDRIYGIGTPVFWKVSKYETKQGARYLIFIGKFFQVGLNSDEFKRLIKEVKE